MSIIKVDGEGQYERVSGSSVGGGTFWGLCRLLTGLQDFDDMLELSAKGNHANVSSEQFASRHVSVAARICWVLAQ